MPEFRRELSKPESHFSATGGVVDTSVGEAVKVVGGYVKDKMVESKVSGLTGGVSSVQDIDPELVTGFSGPPDMRTLESISTARMAGAISGREAEVRARAALRTSKNSMGGLFAREAQAAYDRFFGVSGGAGGSFFKDAKTAEQEGIELDQKNTAELASTLNISYGSAAEIRRNNALNEQRKKDIQYRKDFSTDNISFLSKQASDSVFSSVTAAIFGARQQGVNVEGEFKTNLELSISASIKKANEDFNNIFYQAGYSPTQEQIAFFQDQLSKAKELSTQLIEDSSLRKILTEKTEVLTKTLDIESMDTFWKLHVINKASPYLADQLMKGLENSQYATLVGHSKVMSDIFGDIQDGLQRRKKAGGLLLSSFETEDPLTSGQATSVVSFLSTNPSAIRDDLAFNKIREAMSMVGGSGTTIKRLRGEFDKGGIGLDKIETLVNASLDPLHQSYISDNREALTYVGIEKFSGLTTKGFMGRTSGDVAQAYIITDQYGKKVSSSVYSGVVDAILNAKKFPELWKGKFESPEEYVSSLFNQSGVKPQKETVEDKPSAIIETIKELLMLRDREPKKTEGVSDVSGSGISSGEAPVASESLGEGLPNEVFNSVVDSKQSIQIDYSFIRKQELAGGKMITKATVPAANDSDSGVTIGVGVDLGSKDRAYFEKLGVDSKVIDRLEPYFKLKGKPAKDFLNKNPLTLPEDVLEDISLRVKKDETEKVIKAFEASTSKLPKDHPSKGMRFSQLPKEIQTVVASNYYQYGKKLEGYNFWKQLLDQDWSALYKNLSDFKDRSEGVNARKKREAEYMKGIINA